MFHGITATIASAEFTTLNDTRPDHRVVTYKKNIYHFEENLNVSNWLPCFFI